MHSLPRRLVIAIAVAATALLTCVVVGIYGLLVGPSHGGNPTNAGSLGSSPVALSSAQRRHAIAFHPVRNLPHTIDPYSYARAVADALFNWDSASGYLPTDITAAVLADGDPTGEETAGLAQDVATYEPTTEEWLSLATMDVTQQLQITRATIPSDWSTAVATAHGQLRAGTTAITITGIRHRTGVWLNQPAATATPVSFTVFVACRPAFDRCHVLRLSQVDNPLP